MRLRAWRCNHCGKTLEGPGWKEPRFPTRTILTDGYVIPAEWIFTSFDGYSYDFCSLLCLGDWTRARLSHVSVERADTSEDGEAGSVALLPVRHWYPVRWHHNLAPERGHRAFCGHVKIDPRNREDSKDEAFIPCTVCENLTGRSPGDRNAKGDY